MRREQILQLLEQVASGNASPEAAVARLAQLPFEETGFATIDHHRSLRLGLPEVIYSAGKTPNQVAEIFSRMIASGSTALATRATREHAEAVQKLVPAAKYYGEARIVALRADAADGAAPQYGPLAVICAGTSDIPVAEEAAVTAEHLDCDVKRVYDVGVAGLHRILSHKETLDGARAVIVCAGMEGALPSVVGGLVAAPVIAVPTSVGYGAAFDGLTALLGMLNSCSPNVCVVNIDNGFGAAYVAAMMLRSTARAK